MNIRTILAVSGVAVLLGFLTWGLVNKGESGLAVGEPVPTATLTTLPPGGETSLADYRGKWVLMNVWASWCIPCRKESPALDEFEAKYRDQITVLGVDTRDLSEDAMKFIEEYGLKYAQARDASGNYADDLKTTGSRRTLAIPADVAGALRDHVAATRASSLLWPAPDGGPLWPSTIRGELDKACETAGIDRVRPNELRHTAATRLADRGLPPHVLADYLGHQSTRMLDEVYRHRPAIIRGADLIEV